MASSSCLTSLMLVMMMGIGVVQSGTRNIVRRQTTSNSTHIDGNQLVDCFSALALGKTCDTVDSGDISDIPVPTTTERPGCRCVPQLQCNDDKITAPDGNGDFLTLIDPRSSCKDPFEICCVDIGSTNPPTHPPEYTNHTISPESTNPPTPPEYTNHTISPESTDPPTPPESTDPPPTPPESTIPPTYTSKCGQLNPGGVKTTMIGLTENQAQFGQFPWMAAVMQTGDAGGPNIYLCGGSLIDVRVVMTTAHNIAGKEAQELVVRLGEWNFKFATEPIIHHDIQVKRIVRHPDFAHSRLEYDIALLILESEAVLGPTVDLICLPNQSETYDGASCFSSGWGKDAFGQDGKYQEVLKSLKLPVVSHQQCQNAYRGTVLGNTYNLHKSFVCAGGQGVDTCTGDGGSPLVCPKKTDSSSYVQVGLVSWGIGCGTEGIPGVYASVSEASNWISLKILEEYGINEKRPLN